MSAPISLPPGLDKLVKYEGGKFIFPFMLAPSEPWGGPKTDTDITGWYISEKLDGVRALWTGSHFISRGTRDGGQIYNVPEWFRRSMPAGAVLDGELWLGRGRFNECSGICRRQVPRDADWKQMTFVVFDAPLYGGPFEERLRYVQHLCARDGLANIVAHKQSGLVSMDQIPALLKVVEGMKGEGLIARKPGSLYEFGRRSPAMRKIITKVREDGHVVGYTEGKGKASGMMGTLHVKLADGVIADVGTGFTDVERKNPPPIGAYVTIEFREKGKTGKPRFPAYIGIVAP
jgi:DNA ligase-1